MKKISGLVLVLAAAALGHAEPLPVGRFDARGVYHPVPRRERFSRLHRAPAPTKPRLPVVLVHGIVGFDRIRLGPFYADYWVGLARDLRRRGITVLNPETRAFASIEERARQLAAQIDAAGFERVNLVAHSMGGLDARYLITRLGWADRVASLTTVASPHHGSWSGDLAMGWLLRIDALSKLWTRLGLDRAGIRECSVAYVNRVFNPATPDMPQVRYFSLGGAQDARTTPPPFSFLTVYNRLLEKIAAGRPLSLGDKLALKAFPKALEDGLEARGIEALIGPGVDLSWLDPATAGRNDALISLASARRGEYLGSLDADHLDEIGWLGGFDALRLYRGICRMLADAGF